MKASFETPDGTRFDGYLIGRESFYAFGLFVGGEEYVLNLNLPELVEKNLKVICAHLGKNRMDIFPLKYETNYHFNGKPDIVGTLNL